MKKSGLDHRRFVVISDLHAHPWAAFATGDGADNDRFQRTLCVLRASLARAQQLGIPWVFGGDLVHTAGYVLDVVLSALVRVFSEFPDVPKIVVWGNHDARGVGGQITLDQTVWGGLAGSVANLHVLDPSISPPIVQAGGLTFSGVSAQPRPELMRPPLPSDVGVYHATVVGTCGPNGYVFPYGLDGMELMARHKFTVCGDLHHPQLIADKLLVPGAPEHHNFGDAGPHGWWIVTLFSDGSTTRIDFIPSGAPEFRTVALSQDVREDGNFYRVLTRTVGDALPKNATAVAPMPTVVETRTALRGLTGEQILAAWIQEERPIEALTFGATEDQILALGRQLLSAEDVGQLRNVRLTKLKLTDFCSYADADFAPRDGTWLVLGKGRDFPSNGAGKSTLFEAIFWLLFGRTTKGLTGDEVIRWGANACSVHGIFENEHGGVLEVRRTRGEASRLEVWEGDDSIAWEATSVNEMTDKLAKHIGLTPELFQSLGYFSQERMLLFASATDGERKEMLADLIGLSSYQAAASAAQKRLDQLKLEIAGSEGMQKGTEEHLIAQRATLDQMNLRTAEWDDDRARRRVAAELVLSTFESDLVNVRVQLMQEALQHLNNSNAEGIVAANAALAIAEVELQKQRPTVCTEEQLRIARSVAETTRTGMVRAIAQIEGLERQLVAVRARIAAAESALSGGECPSCGQQIGPEHKQRCLAPLLSEEHALEGSHGMLKLTEASAIHTAADAKLEADACERGVQAGREIARWTEQQQAARARLASLEQAQSAVTGVAEQHVETVLNAKRAELQLVIERITAEINPHRWSAESAAAQVKEAEARMATRQQEQRQLALQASLHDYWRRGFSKQGIQSLLMDEVAGAFNAERGSIFPGLTQGVYDVQFSTLSKTKAGEQRERTEFKVYEHGEVVPYAALSGGQRRRIDVGVMLTLVKAISKWMHVPGALGLLVLDEVFGFLDASGAEGLMEALRDVQSAVPSIYAISHDPQLQALFSGTVLITQDDAGISHVTSGGARADVNLETEVEVQ